MVRLGRSRQVLGAAALVTAVLSAAGCQGVSVGHAAAHRPGAGVTPGAQTSTASPQPSATPAVVSVTPADKAAGVLPTAGVEVRAMTGSLGEVTVKDSAGKPVDGHVQGGAWHYTGRLRPGTAYTVTVTATGPDGRASLTTSTFTTLTPKVTATYGILSAGQTVGVGMPVRIQFDSPVATKAMRAQVEKLVSVTTTPKQQGAWGWLDDRQLMWRPATYWRPGTTVTVRAPLTGVQTGPDKWVANDDQASFTVGAAMISTVNIKTHMMTVTRGGQVLRTIPVSTGKPGPLTETRSGTKVVIGKDGQITMDSATVGIPKGDPNYYKIDTKWNLRLTWTGEFIHSAPWSVNAQGSENVSHGCTNLSPANAEWMFANSRPGDIVKFVGSNRPFLPTEGIGVWQYSFAGWKAQSALH